MSVSDEGIRYADSRHCEDSAELTHMMVMSGVYTSLVMDVIVSWRRGVETYMQSVDK